MTPPLRRPLLAGNWKMNLNHLEAIALVQQLAFSLTGEDYDGADVVVLPPFTALRSVQTVVEADKLRVAYGAQDLSAHDSGAYTGEISGAMLAKLGCTFVTVGHSERREYHGETDATVAAKLQAALRHGLTPILCVGEGLGQRQAQEHVPHTVAQAEAALREVPADKAASVVIAYEPVWAIGTGEVASPADAQEMAGALREFLARRFSAADAAAMRILYGGSVKADNASDCLGGPDVDGALVGGASLKHDDFAGIVRCARSSRSTG
jgi:triosephosphate isomerase